MNESPHLDLAPTSPWQQGLNNSNERVTSPGLGSNIALATQGSTTQMNESPQLDLFPNSHMQSARTAEICFALGRLRPQTQVRQAGGMLGLEVARSFRFRAQGTSKIIPQIRTSRAKRAHLWAQREFQHAQFVNYSTIGVLFRLVWLKIDDTGLDGVYSIYQGHLFFKRPPMYSAARSLRMLTQPRHCCAAACKYHYKQLG